MHRRRGQLTKAEYPTNYYKQVKLLPTIVQIQCLHCSRILCAHHMHMNPDSIAKSQGQITMGSTYAAKCTSCIRQPPYPGPVASTTLYLFKVGNPALGFLPEFPPHTPWPCTTARLPRRKPRPWGPPCTRQHDTNHFASSHISQPIHESDHFHVSPPTSNQKLIDRSSDILW